LKALESAPPAVIVVDLLMPGIDGFEFISRLRSISGARHLPVIVWTVKDVDAAERRRLQAVIVSKGAGGALPLIEAVGRLLAGPAAAAEEGL
jgi:CheY-like chemotaxis protein